jgi:hypothetical protein
MEICYLKKLTQIHYFCPEANPMVSGFGMQKKQIMPATDSFSLLSKSLIVALAMLVSVGSVRGTEEVKSHGYSDVFLSTGTLTVAIPVLSAPESSDIAPVSSCTAPESSGIAPVSSCTAPESSDIAPVSSCTAPESSGIAPVSACIAPVLIETAPVFVRTTPVFYGIAPRRTRTVLSQRCLAPIRTCIVPVLPKTVFILTEAYLSLVQISKMPARASPNRQTDEILFSVKG